MKVIKRVLLVLTVIIWISIVLNACRVENTKKMYPTLPAFDQTNCSEIVIHLCELLVKLTDGELSDDKYYSIQLEIELTYKTLDSPSRPVPGTKEEDMKCTAEITTF